MNDVVRVSENKSPYPKGKANFAQAFIHNLAIGVWT